MLTTTKTFNMAKKKAPASLSTGRPPTLRQKAKSISRRETRTLINKHHTLQKQRQQAVVRQDDAAVSKIDAEIAALGGLEEYQRASLQGQRNDRGGDSSRQLLEWLRPAQSELKQLAQGKHLRMLEVGALSTENACAKCGLFDIVHIDLNSQRPGILQQDFMERPVPSTDEERFDFISLSLVLNYVPDPALRGQMLVRTLQFLREPQVEAGEAARRFMPSLFLVLPRSCVSNSRYCSVERLTELMTILGYSQIVSKQTNKLAYFLWIRSRPAQKPLPPFPKKEVNPGGDRNNFAVVLKPA